MNEKKVLSFVAFAVCLYFAMIAVDLVAQQTVVSNIRGTVSDQGGQIIPGVSVTLQNQRTGVSRSTVSGDTGEYLFDNIQPGLYTLDAELPGFMKYVQTDIDLTASRTIRINVTLEVGEVTETITIEGGTPLIETESPAVSTSARHELMNEVPTAGSIQGGRTPYTFYHALPGAASGVGVGAFSGLPTGMAERMTLDGVRVVEACCQIEPTLEAIDEMKVITHGAPAEYATPSTVQLTTRQGGNTFHGDLWWLYQDKSMDARDSFFREKPIFHGHTFAYSIGGPIIRDKMFFFNSFEGLRFNNSTMTEVASGASSLPTTKMQQGDFSELLDPEFVTLHHAGQFVTIRDPLTGQAFPNNVIPGDRISGVAQSLIARFYLPPTMGPGLVANHTTNVLTPRDRNKADFRVDYILSPQHSVFARYGHTGLTSFLPSTNIRPEHSDDIFRVFPSRSVSISDVVSLGPITNEFKIGFTRTRLAFNSDFDREDVMASAGMTGTGGITGLPGLQFVGPGSFTGIGARGFSNSVSENYGIYDHVTWFRGRHNFKFGFQFNRQRRFVTNEITPPTFRFSGLLSGWTWADFMLGFPSSVSRNLAPPTSYRFQDEWGFFIQDELQVTNNLTLSLGLRYQVWPFAHEKFDKLALFDPNTRAVIVPSEEAKKFVVPTFPQDQVPVLTSAEANYPARNRALTNTDTNDWAPRIGVAWRPFGRTQMVLRGGYGLYYYNNIQGGTTTGGAAFLGSQTLSQQLGAGSILSPIMSFPDPFQAFLTGPVGTLNPETINFSGGDPNLKTPRVHTWNVTLEHEFRGLGARFSYLGSAERGNQAAVNINEAPPGTEAFAQSRRPIPQVRDIFHTLNIGSADSHGLQIVVNRPLVRGFSLNAGYTWMKTLSDTNFFGPGSAHGLDRFRSFPSFATPQQQLILSYRWELPVGRGRPYLSQLHPALEALIGGWRLVGMTKFEAGQWATPFYVGVDPAGTTPGTGPQLPDRIGDGNLSRSARASAAPDQPYFDTSAFVCPGGSEINGQPNLLSQGCPHSTPENVGRWGNAAPNIIQMPGINTWNWSMIKQFPLPREGASLEFAAWITNPWNHPNWANPSMNLSSPGSVGLITSTRQLFLDPWSLGRRRVALQMKIRF